MEMVTLTCTPIAITDKRTGESLKHFPLGPGDVAVADRGDGHPETIVQTVQRGADVLLRLHPHHRPLSQCAGTPLDLVAAWRQQAPASVCTLAVYRVRWPIEVAMKRWKACWKRAGSGCVPAMGAY